MILLDIWGIFGSQICEIIILVAEELNHWFFLRYWCNVMFLLKIVVIRMIKIWDHYLIFAAQWKIMSWKIIVWRILTWLLVVRGDARVVNYSLLYDHGGMFRLFLNCLQRYIHSCLLWFLALADILKGFFERDYLSRNYFILTNKKSVFTCSNGLIRMSNINRVTIRSVVLRES